MHGGLARWTGTGQIGATRRPRLTQKEDAMLAIRFILGVACVFGISGSVSAWRRLTKRPRPCPQAQPTPSSFVVQFMHPESYGFRAFFAGDALNFVSAPLSLLSSSTSSSVGALLSPCPPPLLSPPHHPSSPVVSAVLS